MALNKVYTRINWEDYPSENTDLDAYHLNQMDSAIDALDNRIISQDALKVDKSAINGNIADWTMDETTGVITITKYNGEKIIFDLNIEKIPVGFSMSDDGIITMTTEDGTQFKADIGSMIPVLTFEDSATIAVSVTGTGKNKTYSFSIKTGSVTDAMLQPNYLADIRVESANASAYAQSANAKSVLAESYAIGGTGTREGEDTDNAKYYMEQAKQQTGGIPTKVSELENDVGYITKDVDNLTNYYDKITTDQKLANIDLTDYLKKTGDASNTTVTFTEPTELAQPTTGEKLSGIIGKVSLAIKNVKTLISLIGNTDISSIGNGTVTGAISDVNGNLTYSTEETICGKWIDGRKIYRVVKQVTSNINTNIAALSLPTASRVIDIKGTIETNENRTIPIHCTWETGLSIYAYYYQSEKNIYLNNKVGSGTAYIIVEYIK
jgi:hypothetical protein